MEGTAQAVAHRTQLHLADGSRTARCGSVQTPFDRSRRHFQTHVALTCIHLKDRSMLTRTSFAKSSGAALLALALGLSGAAFAALKSDPAKSSIGAVFKQMNVPVEGKFKKFNAQ